MRTVTVAGLQFQVVARSEEVHRCGKRTYFTTLRHPQAEITVMSEGIDYPELLRISEKGVESGTS